MTMCIDTILVVTTKMTLRLHTLQSLQGELQHTYGRMYNYQTIRVI